MSPVTENDLRKRMVGDSRFELETPVLSGLEV